MSSSSSKSFSDDSSTHTPEPAGTGSSPGNGSFQVKSMGDQVGHQVKLRGPRDSGTDLVAGSNGARGAAIFV